MTTFSVTPCGPQGNALPADVPTMFALIEQTSGETYMGHRAFVIHRDEVDTLVAALKSVR